MLISTLKLITSLMVATSLLGCALIPGAIVGGVIGAAMAPIVQPIVDRALVKVNANWVDPAGTDAVKTNDEKSDSDKR